MSSLASVINYIENFIGLIANTSNTNMTSLLIAMYIADDS